MKLQIIFNQALKYSDHLVKLAVKKAPTIFSGVAIGGVVGVIMTTRKATIKAAEKMEEVRGEEDYEEPETTMDAVKEEVAETWQYYIPVAVIATITIVSIVQSNRINIKRITILTDAYRMSENLRKEYQEKVKEIFGEKGNHKVESAMAQDMLDKDPVESAKVYATGQGNSLMKDCWSGRYFYSDPEAIRQIKNTLDNKLINEDYICLNELYYLLHLELLDIGSEFGWNRERVDRDLTDIRLVPGTASDGRPCHVVTYVVELGYNRYEDF